LGQREHNADRWIAATAIRLGVPLVSKDGIFQVQLETLDLP
jgi:predicted nucleic acid-binding protein